MYIIYIIYVYIYIYITYIMCMLPFTSNAKPSAMTMNQLFGQCKCATQHAAMNEVTWSETARYNTTLARGKVKAAMRALDAA